MALHCWSDGPWVCRNHGAVVWELDGPDGHMPVMELAPGCDDSCWHDPSGTTCMLEKHDDDVPHRFTGDDEIVVDFVAEVSP